MELAALSIFAGYPDGSVHQFHQLSGDGKAETGAFLMVVFLRIYLLEGTEELIQILFPDSLSRILYGKKQFQILSLDLVYFYGESDIAFFRELGGIVHQINDDLADAQGVPV